MNTFYVLFNSNIINFKIDGLGLHDVLIDRACPRERFLDPPLLSILYMTFNFKIFCIILGLGYNLTWAERLRLAQARGPSAAATCLSKIHVQN